jgi:hypothetical protein
MKGAGSNEAGRPMGIGVFQGSDELICRMRRSGYTAMRDATMTNWQASSENC